MFVLVTGKEDSLSLNATTVRQSTEQNVLLYSYTQMKRLAHTTQNSVPALHTVFNQRIICKGLCMIFKYGVTQNGKCTEINNALGGKCVWELGGYQFHQLLYTEA
jgi:hypothetical protein